MCSALKSYMHPYTEVFFQTLFEINDIWTNVWVLVKAYTMWLFAASMIYGRGHVIEVKKLWVIKWYHVLQKAYVC